MTLDEFYNYLDTLPDLVLDDVSEIIAETATSYFKESFTIKEFNKTPWVKANKPKSTGSLMVESGNLVNSIRPAVVNRNRVVISAGNDKVNYAQAHNEGFTGPVLIPAHTRKGKPVKAYTMNQNIPKRQFMGKPDELLSLIYDRIAAHTKTKF